jgi:hypothetical protein
LSSHSSLSQATYENTETENCFNIENEVETGAALKQIYKLIENHQQSDEKKDEEEEKEVEGTSQKRLLEECRLKSYHGALKTSDRIKDFH